MIAVGQFAETAEYLRDVYEEAERKIVEAIARRASRGLNATNWQAQKYAEIKDARAELEKIVADMKGERGQAAQEAVFNAYNAAADQCTTDIQHVTDTLGITHVSRSSGKAARILSELSGELNASDRIILRQSCDAYADVIGRTSALMATGTITTRQACQQALEEFAAKGVTGFVDTAGRHWDMATYTEMATLTAIERATRYGYMDTMESYGYDLAIISSHVGACELCESWESVVVSVSGTNPNYPSLDDAEAGGCFHPRCLHDLEVYYGDADQRYARNEPRDVKEPSEAYTVRSKQRYYERKVRQWKRVEVAMKTAGDAKAERAAYSKVTMYQGKIRALRNEYNSSTRNDWLPRKYDREGGRVTLSAEALKLKPERR